MVIDSLLLYESNDIFIKKMPRVSEIYYSNNCVKVVPTYFDHIQIEKCDAKNFASAFRAFLAHSTFDVKNLFGISNDNNVSVMAWINNGVHTKLRKVFP